MQETTRQLKIEMDTLAESDFTNTAKVDSEKIRYEGIIAAKDSLITTKATEVSELQQQVAQQVKRSNTQILEAGAQNMEIGRIREQVVEISKARDGVSSVLLKVQKLFAGYSSSAQSGDLADYLHPGSASSQGDTEAEFLPRGVSGGQNFAQRRYFMGHFMGHRAWS